MEKITGQLDILNRNQNNLSNGQERLWREVHRLKGEEDKEPPTYYDKAGDNE
ncbi:hypothetical protein [Geomicrobium sp. JCM 19055]|uniref:hypothetical protein n=1 Tax=Geomicrobium sp. JCM 19055 TaxID=1460649 RepID=UPI002235E19E|nr:hypothetical protein [Geomicrobium sp. JCM 19055]